MQLAADESARHTVPKAQMQRLGIVWWSPGAVTVGVEYVPVGLKRCAAFWARLVEQQALQSHSRAGLCLASVSATHVHCWWIYHNADADVAGICPQ